MGRLTSSQDISLDQFSGRTKAPAIAVKPPPPVPKRNTLAPAPVVQHAAHLPKPQLKFKRKPVNTNGAIWYPQLRHKYNAQVPLGYNFNPNDPESEKAMYVVFLLNITHSFAVELFSVRTRVNLCRYMAKRASTLATTFETNNSIDSFATSIEA